MTRFLLVVPLLWACTGPGKEAVDDSAGDTADTDLPGANLFEPADGSVLHGAGQSLPYFQSYSAALTEDTQPAIFMFYSNVGNTRGTNLEGDFQDYLAQYPHAMPQIGMGLRAGGEAADEAVAAGDFDEDLRMWATELKAVDRPVFVRIGFEFNGQHNGYSVEHFPDAFRRVVDTWREEGVTNVAAVWCSSIGGDLLDWYPGDDYVDWWAWDKFYAAAPNNPAVQFMNDAIAHGKPVMIGEASPKGKDTHDGLPVWEAWFEPFFQMISDWPVIKAFCYINWDWEAVDPVQWEGWGIGQIEVNDEILSRYQAEMENPRYVHASEGLHASLGY